MCKKPPSALQRAQRRKCGEPHLPHYAQNLVGEAGTTIGRLRITENTTAELPPDPFASIARPIASPPIAHARGRTSSRVSIPIASCDPPLVREIDPTTSYSDLGFRISSITFGRNRNSQLSALAGALTVRISEMLGPHATTVIAKTIRDEFV
jgi:hypothetical protein